MNAAILASAQGEWVEATERLRQVLERDANNFVVNICFGFDPFNIFTHL